MDYIKSSDCFNCKTVISFIKNIILHPCKILFTFSSVKKESFASNLSQDLNIWLFIPVAWLTFLSLLQITNVDEESYVSFATRNLSISWNINNISSR